MLWGFESKKTSLKNRRICQNKHTNNREMIPLSRSSMVTNLQCCSIILAITLPHGQPENTEPRSTDPPTDRVRGLPYGPVHGLPLRIPSTDHPKME